MHAVIRESSTTTRIRAVFDTSAKTSTGVWHSSSWTNCTCYTSNFIILLWLLMWFGSAVLLLLQKPMKTCIDLSGEVHLRRPNIWPESLLVCVLHPTCVSCLWFCLGVPSCCQGSRGLVLCGQRPHRSWFQWRSDPTVSAATESIRERLILAPEMEFEQSYSPETQQSQSPWSTPYQML